MTDIPLPCLCLVTDMRQCKGRPLDEVVSGALDGGVNMVQLREKDLPAAQLLRLGRRLRELTSGRALLFVNDRVDVALACGADGVQLGEEALPVESVREVAGRQLLVGRSVHTVESAVRAESAGSDLLITGTIFATGSHPGRDIAGLQLLEDIRTRVRTPYLAIGGVNADNVDSVIASGASGAAVISAITRSRSPEQASGRLMKEMEAAWFSLQLQETMRTA